MRSQALPVDPALFLSRQNRCEHRCCRGTSPCPGKPAPKVRLMLSTPNTPIHRPSHFGSFLSASEVAPNSGQTNPSPVASTGGRSGQSGTLLGATGGTQTHSRRTGSKLGQLPCARQGLVRVPESNTKYGGKGRKTGGRLTFPMPPSISESSGIPKRKKLFAAREFGLRPRCSQATIYCSEGLASARLTRR